MASPFISTRVRPRVSGNAAYPHSSPSKTSRSHDFASCPIGGHRRKIYIGPRNIFIDSPFSPRLCFFPFPMMRGIIRRRQRDTEEIRQDGEGEIRRIAGTYHVSVRARPIHYLSSPPLSVSGAGGGGARRAAKVLSGFTKLIPRISRPICVHTIIVAGTRRVAGANTRAHRGPFPPHGAVRAHGEEGRIIVVVVVVVVVVAVATARGWRRRRRVARDDDDDDDDDDNDDDDDDYEWTMSGRRPPRGGGWRESSTTTPEG